MTITRQWRGLLLATSLAVGIAVIVMAASRERRVAGVQPGVRHNPVQMACVVSDAVQSLDTGRVDAAQRKCAMRSPETSMSGLVHDLMVCPSARDRSDSNVISTEDIVGSLTGHPDFRHIRNGAYPCFDPTSYGIRFRERTTLNSKVNPDGMQAHVGQTLCFLAESGVPLDMPLYLPGRVGRLSDVLDDTIATYSLDEEVEWTTVAIAIYIAPQQRWENKFGQEFTFNLVARRLIDRPLDASAVCGGTHTLYCLAALYRVDRRRGILSEDVRAEVATHLAWTSSRLSDCQAVDGSWDLSWAGSTFLPYRPNMSQPEERAWITGHHLDWLALVDEELRLPPGQLKAACELVLTTIESRPRERLLRDPCQFYHGLRAVRRLRGEQLQL